MTAIYEKLLKRHIEDFSSLMNRVEFDLGGKDDGRATDELLKSYRDGNKEPYLEELYYQYGRYLLISSSRKGTPPASLQGVWTVHDKSPWGSGFWHNINIQMIDQGSSELNIIVGVANADYEKCIASIYREFFGQGS